MFKFTTAIFLYFISLVACQYQRDFLVFTAHLTCKLPGIFRYQIQYMEDDTIFPHDRVTRFDSVGNGIGEVISNNFGVMYGDGFLDRNYEIYVIILHNCTKNSKMMREYQFYIDPPCETTGGCKRQFNLDITDLGEEVTPKVIHYPSYSV
ncbi:hypothetical protein CRE_06673 [Caenorhabditis remanei]|uniref:Uncharacterized protein n=1 Tax=Caenorhabditis remanei TaxID=31234 RepID=E3M0V9_CAERE|nr:hypothetical protein CRE_06673 [Caenorhabditis remanei]